MKDEAGELIHGRLSTYTNDKCRCELCRAVNAQYRLEWKERNADKKRKVKRIDLISKDLEVVLTADIAESLRRYIAIHSQELLERRSGVSVRTIRNITDETTQFTQLKIADKLLVTTGDEQMLYDGTVQIVPSPYYSVYTWVMLMIRQLED